MPNSTWPHLVIFGLPFSTSNQAFLARCGVAIFSPGYTNAQRLQILNGTLAYDPNDPEQYNFQAVYSLSADGSTMDFYIGEAKLSDTQWSRVQTGASLAPSGLKYARLSNPEKTLLETNVASLNEFLNTTVTLRQLMDTIGLISYGTRGLGTGGGSKA